MDDIDEILCPSLCTMAGLGAACQNVHQTATNTQPAFLPLHRSGFQSREGGWLGGGGCFEGEGLAGGWLVAVSVGWRALLSPQQ